MPHRIPAPPNLNVDSKKFKNWLKGLMLFLRHRKKHRPKHPVGSLHMFDSVNTSVIPSDAKAVAGYVGGRWPTFPVVQKDWPKAKHLSIAVAASYDADCLDIEPGDATPDQAAAWVKRQIVLRKPVGSFNTTKPVVYTSLAFGQALIDKLTAAGLVYGKDYLWWSAHYTGVEHVCTPKCGLGLKVNANATQFDNAALGKNLDESLVHPGFFV